MSWFWLLRVLVSLRAAVRVSLAGLAVLFLIHRASVCPSHISLPVSGFWRRRTYSLVAEGDVPAENVLRIQRVTWPCDSFLSCSEALGETVKEGDSMPSLINCVNQMNCSLPHTSVFRQGKAWLCMTSLRLMERNAVESGLDQAPKHTSSQSALRGVVTPDGEVPVV